MHKLLAINFGGIGDEILFLPTLQTIRDAHPDWHITLLCEPRSKSVKDITDLIDEVVIFDIKKRPFLSADLVELLGLLRGGNYQTVVSSGSSPLVAVLLFLSGIATRVGYYSGPQSKLLLTGPVKLNQNQYAADMYHDLVQGLGLPKRLSVPSVKVRNANEINMRDFFRTARKVLEPKDTKHVLIHPGSSLLALQKGIYKTWPAERWAILIENLLDQPDIAVVLAGGPDDTETIGEIQELLKAKNLASRVVSAFGKTKSLADLAALIDACDLLVCVDSAPMHLAVGLGKPLVALFGPTDRKKLLPVDKRFKPLPDETFLKPGAKANGNGRVSLEQINSQPLAERGVLLPPDIVFQSVLDQLQSSTAPKRFQESLL